MKFHQQIQNLYIDLPSFLRFGTLLSTYIFTCLITVKLELVNQSRSMKGHLFASLSYV